MFLKPLKIRSQQQMKTSEKKRLIEEVRKNFAALTNENLENIFPKKEDVLLLKIETGSKLLIPVYTVKDQPVLFICNQNLIPTLHMLWKCPNIVLVFKTHAEVLKKLVCGADLMLPGVIEPCTSNMSAFSKDTPACVTSNNRMAPAIVGVTAADSNDMSISIKGKCVNTVHVIGDKLFHLKSMMSNIPSPLEELLILMKKCQVEVCSDNQDRIAGNDGRHNVRVPIIGENQVANKTYIENEHTNISSEEMDDLLIHTLFVAIKYSKGLSFPILTSNFFKIHMVPACPQNKTLDIKKSSFRKCGHFMKHMMELGILKVEEQKKGIEHITEFNYEHPLISEFYLHPSDRPKDDKGLKNSLKPIISEAHCVTAAVLPIFAEFDFKKGSIIDNSEIRKFVTLYVKQHNLQDENFKNFVNLNDALSSVLRESCCTFEELIKSVYNLMSPCFKVICGDSVIIHKGKLEPINITIARRAGNKKVTLIDNVELYGININELGNMCQRGIAASTTIVRFENPRKGSQLLIQGNQVMFVYTLLTEKCLIPKRHVKGLEFVPKK